jgi:hypothetical protein
MRIIGRAAVATISAVAKRRRVANVFATRFGPNQDTEALRSYLREMTNTEVECTKLTTKYPDHYSSFYIRAECDDPEIFMSDNLWPEGILVRWYRPSDSKTNSKRVKPVVISNNNHNV